jgi:hypothetical protein
MTTRRELFGKTGGALAGDTAARLLGIEPG